MLRYNTDSIIVGYLKQYLKSFNLPTFNIFEDETELIDFIDKVESPPNYSYTALLKNYDNQKNCIVSCEVQKKSGGSLTTKIHFLKKYEYNQFILNNTKQYTIENLLYDQTTHKFLGEVLRFNSKYTGINLMPMYNCFLNEIVEGAQYNYYKCSAKLAKTYTLITRTVKPFKYLFTTTTKLKTLEHQFTTKARTCEQIPGTSYFTMDFEKGSFPVSLFEEYNLMLYIQVPKGFNMNFVVLEGSLSDFNIDLSKCVANFDNSSDLFDINSDKRLSSALGKNKFIDKLNKGDKTIYAASFNLFQYLLGNVITKDDPVSRNIRDAKIKLRLAQGVLEKDIDKHDYTFGNLEKIQFANLLQDNLIVYNRSFDITGYVDKSIETVLDNSLRS